MSQAGKVSDSDLDETASLAFLAGTKSVRKYGSTTHHQPGMKPSNRVIEHKVQPSDTLQGLALRYRTTMEHIKRFNRLWTNDSLFLRELLKIPVSEDFREDADDVSFPSVSSLSSEESPTHIANHSSSILEGRDKGLPSCQTSSNDLEPDLGDFLGRMDSNIAKSKIAAEKLHDSSLILKHPVFGDAYSGAPLRRSQSSRLKPHSAALSSYQTTEFGASSNGDPYVTTTGKKVWSSLQRLEQKQDEMFEL